VYTGWRAAGSEIDRRENAYTKTTGQTHDEYILTQASAFYQLSAWILCFPF